MTLSNWAVERQANPLGKQLGMKTGLKEGSEYVLKKLNHHKKALVMSYTSNVYCFEI